MNAVIDSILRENTEYYRRVKSTLVARLLVNERGTIISKQISGKTYKYLRRTHKGKQNDFYLGPANSSCVARIERTAHQSKNDLVELRRAKYALKKLRAKNMDSEDFTARLKELFNVMDEAGLWDEGHYIVGPHPFERCYQ